VGPCGAVAETQERPEAAHRLTAIEARRLLTRLGVRAADIRRCLAHGRRRRLEHVDMIWMENPTGQPRLGLIVPKFQSSAVARNRLRRRLREIWRRDLQAMQPGWDLLIRARREAYDAGFDALRAQLLAWRDAVIQTG
jgi:ribonuclease P protein component